jgi:predicted metal-dependent hydrolase
MAAKKVEIEGIGTVSLYKRRGAHTIRLSVNSRGEVRVTQPYWLPYAAGLEFARSRQAWISENLIKRVADLTSGQLIGKTHHLLFEASPTVIKASSRVNGGIVRVTHPAACRTTDPSVQQVAQKASIRALRDEAEAMLPDRLATLAKMHGFTYRSVQVKRLTGRWGSCDAQQNIVLNLFLMQLSWDLIDYVLLHELTHTNILRHGPDFWRAMERVLPTVQIRRKAMRQHHPAVGA